MTFDELPRGGEDPHRDHNGAVCHAILHVGHDRPAERRDADRLEYPQYRPVRGAGDARTARRLPSLVAIPMFHLGGMGWAIWSMQAGATLVIVREIVPEALLDTMIAQRVETALLVPAVMLFVCELPQAKTADFSALKHITYGTAPISAEVLRRSIETFKCRLSQIYGLTETTGPFTSLPHEHHVGERLASCGRPMFGARARIVDENGNELPPDAVGEILYQGESMMAGYWGRQAETEAVIRDGWFHTGDAGYMDRDGFLFIKDRIRDMIITGGENVYPAEIEAVLAEHPDLLEVAVIGVPDPKWGERSRHAWSGARARP